MSQLYHIGSGTPSSEPPTKRRRGRPCKDESRTPITPRLKPTIPHDLGKGKSPLYHANTSSVNGEDQMLGQVVIGVLEGAFDAGYFLTMRLAKSEIYLKGLVFQPGKFVPITSENDIAPLARMYSRADSVSNCESIHLETQNVARFAKDKDAEKECVELETTNQTNPSEAKGSNAKDRLEILASVSAEMDFTKPMMEVCEGERVLCDQSHELAQRDPPMEPLAKKSKTEETMHWKEAISAEELKAATTLNELEILESIKEHGKSLGGVWEE